MRSIMRVLTTLMIALIISLSLPGCSDSAQSQSGEYEVVQLIGNYNNATIEAVRSNLVVVPFSPDYNPQLTPIMIAPGVLEPADALTQQEKDAIKASYEAGQTLALIAPSTIDVEAFHGLLGAGAAFESTTDPVLLAYIMRREDGMPTASALLNIRRTPDTAEDPGADERAYARAYDLVVDDLSRSPLPSSGPTSELTGAPIDLSKNYIQSTVLKTTSGGIYSMPVNVHAGRICNQSTDFYVITSRGDWDPTEAKWQSASYLKNQISLTDDNRGLTIDWQDSEEYCSGGTQVWKNPFGGGFDSRMCRYMNYPLNYWVAFNPPVGPKTTQVSASPSGNQGRSTQYTNSFSFNLGVDVNVSGDGPQAGLQAGASWSKSVSTTVPALVVEAGDIVSDLGAYTKYEYCTEGGSAEDCVSTIQMAPGSNVCQDYIVGQPQNGQTPNGRLSSTLQAAAWQVDSNSYSAGTSYYDLKVTWDTVLATSTSRLWGGAMENTGPWSGIGPTGSCNSFGCSCSISSKTTQTVATSFTFKVPLPSSCSAPSPPTPPPPTPGSDCSTAFCAANPGASCTATPSCAYCDQGECHE